MIDHPCLLIDGLDLESCGQPDGLVEVGAEDEGLVARVEHVGTPAHGGQRQPICHPLAERHQIGTHIEQLVGATQREVEPALDLVDDEERARLVRQLTRGPQKLRAEETRLRGHEDRGDVALVLLELPLESRQVIAEVDRVGARVERRADRAQ